MYFNITQIEIDIEPTDKVSNQFGLYIYIYIYKYVPVVRYVQAYHKSAILVITSDWQDKVDWWGRDGELSWREKMCQIGKVRGGNGNRGPQDYLYKQFF